MRARESARKHLKARTSTNVGIAVPHSVAGNADHGCGKPVTVMDEGASAGNTQRIAQSLSLSFPRNARPRRCLDRWEHPGRNAPTPFPCDCAVSVHYTLARTAHTLTFLEDAEHAGAGRDKLTRKRAEARDGACG